MKFGWTIIYVENVRQTVEFYERCFGISRREAEIGEEFAEMETGGTRLAFTYEGLASNLIPAYRRNRADTEPSGFELAFIADDVEAAYQRAVNGGATSVAEPAVKPWGQTVAYVRDLNGVLVELASAMN